MPLSVRSADSSRRWCSRTDRTRYPETFIARPPTQPTSFTVGSWNAKPFGNDTAADWLWKLEEARDAAPLKKALAVILQSRRTPSTEACERAIAAAAVISSARSGALRQLPRAVRRWIDDHAIHPSDTLIGQAIRATERIRASSRLSELWDESPAAARWQAELRRLVKALRTARTAPVRKVRPPPTGARLSLAQLIAQAHPDRDDEIRAALRRKLAALPDVNAVVPGTWQRRPLHLVAERGLNFEAAELLRRGAEIDPVSDIDPTVPSPIEVACGQGRTEMVQFLLEQGAVPHRIMHIDESGSFPMPVREETPNTQRYVFPATFFFAIDSGSIPTVELLLRHGVDPNHVFRLNGETALHRAAEADAPAMIRFLANLGLNLDASSHIKATPLHLAVMNSRRKAVVALLEVGADPNAKDDEGATALDHAQAHRRLKNLAATIRKCGGRNGD